LAAKIKLQRKGAKNRPFYRVVVQDESAARNSRVVEILGQYDPLAEPSLFDVDKEKTKEWLAKGAMPTEKVRILLGKAGILPPVDLAALPKRKPKGEAEKKEEKPASAEAPAEKPAAEAQEEKKEEKKEEEKKEEEKKEEEKKEEEKKEEPAKEA